MERDEVYDVLNGERAYQDALGAEHIRPDLTLGEHLLAIERNLSEAREMWYRSKGGDYRSVMHRVRKVAGQAILAMEENGVPRREGF